MISPEKKKQKLCVTVSLDIKEKIRDSVETGDLGKFASDSDLVQTALIEFFARKELLRELEEKGVRLPKESRNTGSDRS